MIYSQFCHQFHFQRHQSMNPQMEKTVAAAMKLLLLRTRTKKSPRREHSLYQVQFAICTYVKKNTTIVYLVKNNLCKCMSFQHFQTQQIMEVMYCEYHTIPCDRRINVPRLQKCHMLRDFICIAVLPDSMLNKICLPACTYTST